MAQKNDPKKPAAPASKAAAGSAVDIASLEKFLKGATYPKDKKSVIEHLKKNNANPQVLGLASRITEKKYANEAELKKEFSQVK